MLLFQNWYLWRVKKTSSHIHKTLSLYLAGSFQNFRQAPPSFLQGGFSIEFELEGDSPLVYIDLLIVSHVATWCDFTRIRSLRDWFSLRLWNSNLNSVGFTLASCCKSENRINCLQLLWFDAPHASFKSSLQQSTFNFLDIAECFTCLADALETNNFVNCLRNKPTNYLVKWMWTGAVTS